jgi:Tfp pilus assembly protein PilF
VLFDRALERSPDDIVGLTGRGALELDDGSPFAARRYLERAHDLGHTPLTAANLGAVLLTLGEFESARALMAAVVGTASPPELLANLAFAELSTGKPDAARESLRRALAAGADARNPRLVALDRLIGDAERAVAAAAAAAGAAATPAPAPDAP